MKEKSFGATIKSFFTKLGKKNLIIVGAVVLIGAAVMLNWVFFSQGGKKDDNYTYKEGAGMSTEYGTKLVTEPVGDTKKASTTDSYFTSVATTRQQARDEALEVLNAVVKNENAADSVKSEAVAEIAQISKEMNAEANIESLVCSKGFDKCVAVINGDSATIVVSNETGMLKAAELAQINAIVYEQSGIIPANITVSAKKS